MANPVTIILTGDVMLGRGVNSYLLRAGPAYPWGNTRPTLSAADLLIINLDASLLAAVGPGLAGLMFFTLSGRSDCDCFTTISWN
jgi:Bacterial capsule synthesis protein PGA_cap